MEDSFTQTLSQVITALCKNAYQWVGFVPQTVLVCIILCEMVGMTQCVCVCVYVCGSLKDKKPLCIIS